MFCIRRTNQLAAETHATASFATAKRQVEQDMSEDTRDWAALLTQLLHQLDSEDALGAQGQETVTLYQQSVGRLSRMDALQQQAMAKANQARRNAQRQAVLAALNRVHDGSFGMCAECDEPIAPARLRLNPTVLTCINCAS